MTVSLLLGFAECCYYACIGILVALAVLLSLGLGYLSCGRLSGGSQRSAPGLPERDPDRDRARQTARAFRRIVDGDGPQSPNLRDVGRRGQEIVARQRSSQKGRALRSRAVRRGFLRIHIERQPR